MCDALRTSLYQIVSAFGAHMQANAKALLLENNYISERKPLYGSRGILVRKLQLFFDFRRSELNKMF